MGDPTGLFSAVRDGDIDTLRSLVEERPDLAGTRNDEGVSVILFALYHGRSDALDVLLGAGTDLDIFEAAALGAGERIVDLLDSDERCARAYSSDGWTALHLASFFGHPDAVRALLECGADPAAAGRNAMANQPLHGAAAGGHLEVCQTLLTRGAEVNATQCGGWTALHSASQRGDRPLVELLLRHGADMGIGNDEGETPADTAAKAGHAELAEDLRGSTDAP